MAILLSCYFIVPILQVDVNADNRPKFDRNKLSAPIITLPVLQGSHTVTLPEHGNKIGVIREPALFTSFCHTASSGEHPGSIGQSLSLQIPGWGNIQILREMPFQGIDTDVSCLRQLPDRHRLPQMLGHVIQRQFQTFR